MSKQQHNDLNTTYYSLLPAEHLLHSQFVVGGSSKKVIIIYISSSADSISTVLLSNNCCLNKYFFFYSTGLKRIWIIFIQEGMHIKYTVCVCINDMGTVSNNKNAQLIQKIILSCFFFFFTHITDLKTFHWHLHTCWKYLPCFCLFNLLVDRKNYASWEINLVSESSF